MEGESTQTGRHRAVVWHAPDVAPPHDLMAALAGRGIEAIRVQSPYRALAELCRVGGGRGASPAIVIVHPEMQPDALAFWEAKSRYVPGARCWMYGPMAKPVLRAIVEADIAGWGGQREPKIVVRPQPKDDSLRFTPRREAPRPATPKLKLTGEPLPVPAEVSPEETSKAPLLSPEELRMLLGDDEPGAAEGR